MSAPTIDESARRRALRRRHLLQRQTIIFGAIVLALVALALSALGVYLGILPPPFDPDFTDTSVAESTEVVPCPPDGALPVPFGQITANVYNGTTTAGLAGSTATTLQGAGVLTAYVQNYPGGSYDGATLIVTGSAGVPAAYTMAAMFPGATITLDPVRTDATIDVVIGSTFQPMLDPATSTPDPATPLTALEGCTALTATPAGGA